MAKDKRRLELRDGCKLGGIRTWFISHTIMLEAIYLHHVVFHKITSLVPTGLLLLGSLALGEMPNIRVTEPAGDYFGTSSYYDDNANVSRALDALLFGYDKRLRPHYRKKPVEVGITMHISSVSSISEVDMDFTVDFYFRQFWHDPRLAHDLLAEEVCISTEMLQRMWWPDTFFANAKNAKFHTATTKNAFLRIQPNGYVLLSLRLTVTAMCRMDLKYFPMDSQVCPLEIESFGYQLKDIGYKWQDGPGRSVKFETGVHVLPQFKVKGHRQVQRVIGTSTGNYSRLSCEFFFVRSMGYYLIQIYIPSILIVVLSWVSFWLSREAVPARVALGITTVLTMTTLISSTNAALPKISYLKSIDVYLVTCFVMVFASLLEYAAVSYIGNRCKKKLLNSRAAVADSCGKEGRSNGRLTNGALMSRSASSHSNGPQPAYDTEVRITSLRKLHTECDLRAISAGNYFRGETGSCICRRQPRPPELPVMPPGGEMHGSMCLNPCTCTKPSAIDKYSRFLFPLIFTCFNIMYWLTYMSISVHPDEKYFTSVH